MKSCQKRINNTSCITVCIMPTISIRITDEERRKLEKLGSISKVVREAIKFYINSERKDTTLKKLKALQERYKLRTGMENDLALLREDRRR